MPHASAPASLADLSHNALIAVSGDDAAAFLQGQLTNDVEALAVGQAQWSGWCSPKGRLLATLLLARRGDGYLAMLPAGIAPAIAKRLGMFVLRSKVKIRDASSELERYGLAGPGAAQIAQELKAHADIVTAPIGGGLFVVIAPANDPRIAALRGSTTPCGPEAWDLALIRAGIPTIVAATQEAFVPQMANLDLVGGVSFRKGCYTGQEIVARTQYRGILKRRMAIAHVDGAAPAPGQSVYSSAFGDQAAGTVVNAAPAPEGGYDFLVVAQVESLGGGGLHLGAPDGAPIAIRSHPASEPAPQ
jgi:folate-binding protein YgfZ